MDPLHLNYNGMLAKMQIPGFYLILLYWIKYTDNQLSPTLLVPCTLPFNIVDSELCHVTCFGKLHVSK